MSEPNVSLYEFLLHCLPRFIARRDVLRGFYEFKIKHPTRECGFGFVLTDQGWYRLLESIDKESATNDDIIMSDQFRANIIRMLKRYIDLLESKEDLEYPKTSDVLRDLILGELE